MTRHLMHSILVFASLTTLAPLAAAAPKEPAPKQADPFAEAPAPTPGGSVEDMEAAALAPPTTAPPPTTPPAAAPPPPSRAAPRPRVRQRGEETEAASGPEPSQRGFAVELATGGFASGTLNGGVFVGGRTAGGIVVGGLLDFASTSTEITTNMMSRSTSLSAFRVGAGARLPLLHTADRRVDLFAAVDAAVVFRSAEAAAADGTPETGLAATGVSLALGPGLRLWVHEQLALGYAARLRLDYLSGEAGALVSPPTADTSSASATAIAFDGVFQLLAVF